MPKTSERREALRIIGAVGVTCAFPFSADELYGQHQHHAALAQIQPAGPYQPKAFSPAEWQTISRVADLIIPPTDTPGAVAAGVPQYIDFVVAGSAGHRKNFSAGIEWLDRAAARRFRRPFRELSEARQIALLTPLSEAVDAGRLEHVGHRFFRLMKSMTADGYYTSRIGLVDDLGYRGNSVLTDFPECTHPEHKG